MPLTRGLAYKDFGLAQNPSPEVAEPIAFGGTGSKNPLNLGCYDADQNAVEVSDGT